jgi:rhomboid protease GluP
VAFLIGLVILGVIVYGSLTPDERVRVLRIAVGFVRHVLEQGREEREQYEAILRIRMQIPAVTLAIAGLNVILFAGMLFGAGSHGDPATLVSWGASYGPRTTNGEWWRLLTTTFVHASFFVLLVNVVAIVQLGSVLERLVGRPAMAAAYAAAGMIGAVAAVASFPMRVTAGASNAVFGLYGLLLAIAGANRWRRSPLSIPSAVFARIGAVFVLFVACALFADHGFGGYAAVAAFVTGVLAGIAAAHDLGDALPEWRRAAAGFGIAATAVIAAAIPVRGITDVRPEVDRLVSIEHRTAAEYRTASGLFTKGRINAWQLADVIEQSIMPAIAAEQVRVIGLHGVPTEDQHLVADAREYLELRSQSWQLRVKGLRQQNAHVDPSTMDANSKLSFRAWAQAHYESTLRTMGKAEGAERASLQAFNRLTP